MIPKLCRIGAILALAAIGFVSVPAPEAKCAACLDVSCLNSNNCAGKGCVCLKQGSNPTGQCVSIDYAESFLRSE